MKDEKGGLLSFRTAPTCHYTDERVCLEHIISIFQTLESAIGYFSRLGGSQRRRSPELRNILMDISD